jgi:hypothetical protein
MVGISYTAGCMLFGVTRFRPPARRLLKITRFQADSLRQQVTELIRFLVNEQSRFVI